MNNAYQLDNSAILKTLASNQESGLSQQQADIRLAKYGPNELREEGKRSALYILFSQLKEVMVIILFVAALISLFLHEYIDAAVIMVIVILNTIIGFWQENNAENAMAALKKLAVPNIRVRRDGQVQEISATKLVPGDIIILEAGNIVPVDARILNASNLKVQEAALTGESEPVNKVADVIAAVDVPLADRKNMIYMGTTVTYGRATALVTETGMNTELGKIATMMQQVEDEQTPLQARLDKLGKSLAALALLLIAVVAAVTYFRGVGIKETFMTAISMAVAAIPEGLPAVVTIALALGAQRMLKRKALIRHLPAVETLGSVTIICSDKTGTLTQNKMTVTDIALPDSQFKFADIDSNHDADSNVKLLLLTGALCNDAQLTEPGADGALKAIGDPTEGALVIAANKVGLNKATIEKSLLRAAELPFDSDRKRMTTIHHIPTELEQQLADILPAPVSGKSDYIAFTKGSVDGLIDVCSHILKAGKISKMAPDQKKNILAENQKMAENGIRVLGMAFRFIAEAEVNSSDKYEQQLVYIGMTGMIDPVRPEAIDAVGLCQKAGIQVVMITGDHPLTAKAIATELGILTDGKYLTGQELSKMIGSELKANIDNVRLFARVSPEHKMVLIDALQEKRQIVSMTGDGVNDAPALKSADIGVAMGITGTDVARESSDMVLLDDNFATIVSAVKEGRTIYDNIRKFVKYILTGNAGEILVMLIGPFLGMPLPLLPIQILWINLVTDGLPAIALGYEKSENNVMDRPPFNPQEGIFSRGIGRQILTMGVLVGLISLIIGFIFWKLEPDSRAWQTMVFTSLTFSQMAFAFTVRKNLQSFFKTPLFGNLVMFGAVSLSFVLQLVLIYVPFFNTIFRTVPLTGFQLAICLAASLIVILFTEIEKLIYRRKHALL